MHITDRIGNFAHISIDCIIVLKLIYAWDFDGHLSVFEVEQNGHHHTVVRLMEKKPFTVAAQCEHCELSSRCCLRSAEPELPIDAHHTRLAPNHRCRTTALWPQPAAIRISRAADLDRPDKNDSFAGMDYRKVSG